MSNIVETVIDKFLRPTQASFSAHSLGPFVTISGDGIVVRKDMLIEGIPASFYKPVDKQRESTATIIYCHSYNSNRSEAVSLLKFLKANSLNMVSFDFQRTRNGEICKDGIISLGMHEARQLATVVEWVNKNIGGKIILWGRSMGAFVALRSQIEFGGGHALVLDSPYLSLEDLITKTVEGNSIVPGFVVQGGIRVLRPHLNKAFGFDIEALNILPKLSKSKAAVVFICSLTDQLSTAATDKLYKQYTGKKTLMYTEKRHYEQRQQDLLQNVVRQAKKNCKEPRKQNHMFVSNLFVKNKLPSSTSMHRLSCKSHMDIEKVLQQRKCVKNAANSLDKRL